LFAVLAVAVFFAAEVFLAEVFLAGAGFLAVAFFAGAAFLAGADFFAVAFFAEADFLLAVFVADDACLAGADFDGLRGRTLRAADAAELASDFLVLRAMKPGPSLEPGAIVAGATVSTGG
jgi:hypothetical protein